jgi:hypothetical protein
MEEPFILYLYHLSPVQRLLNRSAFNWITRQKFWKSSWKPIEERDDLLKVELGSLVVDWGEDLPLFLANLLV